MARSLKLQDWYRLTKPGIVYGNGLHAVAGIILAAALYDFNLVAAIGGLVGVSMVIASACVANNYLDRQLDAKMKRTKARATAAGRINLRAVVYYSGGLGLIGGLILTLATNWLTVGLGIIAYIFYVWVYGYAKRTTVHSTLVGSIPGALPAVAGYTALAGQIDLTAIMIFGLLFIWQLPHFYAIAIFRRDEYTAADLPIITCVWPLQRVVSLIRWNIGLYWLLVMVSLLYVLSWPAGVVLLLVASYWLALALRPVADSNQWARQIFGSSLIVTLAFAAVAVINLAVVQLTTLY